MPRRRKDRPSKGRKHPVARRIGTGSSFGRKPWWDSNWWLLDQGGHSRDIACDIGTVGDLAVAAASIRGNSHRYHGERCEDSFCFTTGTTAEEGPFLVVVVGDGLTSASHSAYGSARATYLFANKLASRLSAASGLTDEVFMEASEEVIEEVRTALKSWAPDDYLAPTETPTDVDPAAFDTTLTFAVLPARTTAPEELRTLRWGTIGDSPIFKLSADGWEKVSTRTDREVIDSATRTLYSATEISHGGTELTNDEVLVLTTDGVGDFLVDSRGTLAVGSDLAERWQRPVGVESFISDLMFDLKSADDDRTAVVCWPDRTRHSN